MTSSQFRPKLMTAREAKMGTTVAKKNQVNGYCLIQQMTSFYVVLQLFHSCKDWKRHHLFFYIHSPYLIEPTTKPWHLQFLSKASDFGLGISQLHREVLPTFGPPHTGGVTGRLGRTGSQWRQLDTVSLLG